MVLAAAAAHGVLLCEPQSGQSLASVEHARRGALENARERARRGRGAGQRLEKVERRALARQQAAGRAREIADDEVGVDRFRVVRVPRHADPPVDLPEGLVEPRAAAERRGLARDDLRPTELVRVDEVRGEVARADVLRERGRDDGRDVARQRRRRRSWRGQRVHPRGAAASQFRKNPACPKLTMLMSIGIDSTVFVREAMNATRRAFAICSAVASTRPSTFF